MERIIQMPNTRTRKTVYDADAKLLGGSGCIFHFFDGTLIHTFGITISPNVIGQNSSYAAHQLDRKSLGRPDGR